ncbi:hypothetical protein [Halomonas nitroreducens]|uniref:Uncharacterized protein n=1 Tax=Halomonas nitroreducens TaxID=447425 RepID=A0A431V1Y8_9GAMM|nr:hypothetical protein [Halomonas nitroreducens]RTR02404.1 hypothetical protein EKG36_12460 [Halomonas nitroreducens]
MRGRTLFAGPRPGLLERPLTLLLLAAGTAIWLLLQPETLQALPLAWRLPLVGIGAWALGSAFARPLTLEVGEGWLWRQAGARWSRLALWGFALVVGGLGVWG